MALLAAAALAVLLGLLGSRFSAVLAAPADGVLFRAVLSVMGGAVVLHLLLTALDLAGAPWNPFLLAALGALLFALARRLLPRGPERAGLTLDPGWGHGLALFALAAFTLPALTGWTAIPDFVYHWGLKGHRFYLAGGVDYAYLGRGWNWVLHPDYPNLLPELSAVSASMAGGFHLPAMMLQSGLLFALLLAAAREGLRQGGADRFTREAGLALVALGGGAFGIGHRMAGGADWMISLALAAAVPPLLRPPDRAGDLQIGVTAAFAAAAKIEGVPLAAFLVLVQWARRRQRLDLAAAARLALPPAAVVLPWLAQTLRHHLFLENNSGPFDPGRAGTIFAAAAEALRTPAGHGFLFLALLPPLLLFHRRLRPFALVGTLHILFCLYVYFTAVVGDQLRIFVLSNGARLAFQLVPASLVAGLVAWGGSGRSFPQPRISTSSPSNWRNPRSKVSSRRGWSESARLPSGLRGRGGRCWAHPGSPPRQRLARRKHAGRAGARSGNWCQRGRPSRRRSSSASARAMSALVSSRLPGRADEKSGNRTLCPATAGGGPAARSFTRADPINSRKVTPRSMAAIFACFSSSAGRSRVVRMKTSCHIPAPLLMDRRAAGHQERLQES